MPVTRTLGPLHFEDLEPKRFEDLVRQLVYDFKPWRRLEATGRAGSDDGFDARGYEMVAEDVVDEEEAGNEAASPVDRLWLIQCKRERTITPAKLREYLGQIRLIEGEPLHGIVFAAACDFSKKSHDEIRQYCQTHGIAEWHLWGKAELEDQLYLSKNDGLLFAYFGISLAIRRRSMRTELRGRLAIKRKAQRILEPFRGREVLLRSPEATAYPHPASVPDFARHPPWLLSTYKGMVHDGLLFVVRRHFAYLNDTRDGWDAAFIVNDGRARDDPWAQERDDAALRGEIWRAWDELPANNKAWLELHALVPFDAVVEMDDIGDEYFHGPHVYVGFTGDAGPFTGFRAEVEPIDRFGRAVTFYPSNSNDGRVEIFRPEWREHGAWEPYTGHPRRSAAG